MTRAAWGRILRFFLRVAIALVVAFVLLMAESIDYVFPLFFLVISTFVLAENKAIFSKSHLTIFKLE